MNAALQTHKTQAQPLASSFTRSPTRLFQRKCACGGAPGLTGSCEECEQSLLQRRTISRSERTEVPPIVHEVLRSPGRPLDPADRAFMEPRFGHDFSRVRVHTDAKAAESARAVNALAYTVGPDIVFAAEQYAPQTPAGRQLLAHELTHVIQQQSSAALSNGFAGMGGNHLEMEAERAAASIVQGNGVAVSGTTSNGLQRSPAWDTDALAIELEPLKPTTPPQVFYTEDGVLHQRMSNNLPVYRGPFCQNSLLPFDCNVSFRVDFADDPRPQPFTPPQLSVNFQFAPPRGGFSLSKNDKNPRYAGASQPLETSFGHHFIFTLDDNGPFTMEFKLQDPDSGITRVYTDTIQIEAKRPCV